MKKLCLFVLSFLIILSLALPVAAEELPSVVDQAGLLTDHEESALSEKAASLRDTYQMDIVIVTNLSLGGKTPETYADDYYDTNGYGDDGILFLLSMENRDWYISTCGSGIYALTDYGIQKLGSSILGDLGGGRYYEAFDAYLEGLAPYLDAFRAGDPIDGRADYSNGGYHGTREETVRYRKGPSWLLSLFIGAVTAGVSLGIMAYSMNTKRRQPAAGTYMEAGSFHLSRNQDLFLYSRVSKTRRQESSSGGGSSTHRSSGGRSHGGGGGKF